MLHFKEGSLTVFQSSLYKTTSAVVETRDAVILSDPTWLPEEIEAIRNFITRQIGNRKLYVIYTHSDFDHIIGSGAFPEAMVIASEEFQNNSEKEQVLKDILAFDQAYYIDRPYDVAYPAVDKAIKKDGEKLVLNETTLTFYKAPGHTEDGLFTVIEPDGIFLSGDYLSDVEFPFITSSYDDYVDTVDKAALILQHHDIKVHVPGHGTVTTEKEEVQKRINDSKNYLKRLKEQDSKLEQELKENYRFFEGMKNSHAENIRKENSI